MEKHIKQPVQIVRDKNTQIAQLIVELDSEWSLFIEESKHQDERVQPVLRGKGKGVFPFIMHEKAYDLYRFVTKNGSYFVAERRLPMSGAFNFRDIGGYKTKEGRYVQWKKLFRADDISNLTESDIQYLHDIPITSVIDFRALGEAKRTPDKLPATARFTYPIAITPGYVSTQGEKAIMLKTDVESYMKEMNRLLVSDPLCIRAYRIFFAVVQNNLSAPLVYHCSAGKDRTGMATALILFALGVEEETVVQDYMLSKDFIFDKYAAFIAKYPRAESLFTVKESYIEAGIDQIKKDHGSINNFLTKVLKVDLVKMKRLYLQR